MGVPTDFLLEGKFCFCLHLAITSTVASPPSSPTTALLLLPLYHRRPAFVATTVSTVLWSTSSRHSTLTARAGRCCLGPPHRPPTPHALPNLPILSVVVVPVPMMMTAWMATTNNIFMLCARCRCWWWTHPIGRRCGIHPTVAKSEVRERRNHRGEKGRGERITRSCDASCCLSIFLHDERRHHSSRCPWPWRMELRRSQDRRHLLSLPSCKLEFF